MNKKEFIKKEWDNNKKLRLKQKKMQYLLISTLIFSLILLLW